MCMTIEAANMVSSLSMPQLTKALSIAEGWLTEPDKDLTIYRGIPTGLLPQDLVHEWQVLNKQQCPFLMSNMLCLIHEWRPLTCRAFGIFRDGMPLCPRPPGKGETLTQKAVIKSDGVRKLVVEFRERAKSRNPGFVISGYIPTLMVRAASPDKLKALIADNKIPSAKLIGVDINLDLLWQPQLDALRAGVGPNEVILRDMKFNAS